LVTSNGAKQGFRTLVPAIQNAGQVMTELAKDKVNEKSADRFTDKFLKEIDEVETELTRHINYLGQVCLQLVYSE
jgi:hypothetical protein